MKTHGDARTRTWSPDVSMFSPSTREGEAARSGKTTEMNIMPKIELNNLYQWFGLKTVCIFITQLADMSFISCWDTLWYIRIISYYTLSYYIKLSYYYYIAFCYLIVYHIIFDSIVSFHITVHHIMSYYVKKYVILHHIISLKYYFTSYYNIS